MADELNLNDIISKYFAELTDRVFSRVGHKFRTWFSGYRGQSDSFWREYRHVLSDCLQPTRQPTGSILGDYGPYISRTIRFFSEAGQYEQTTTEDSIITTVTTNLGRGYVIVGEPGIGKTSCLKDLFCKLSKRSDVVPIYIRLDRHESGGILDSITDGIFKSLLSNDSGYQLLQTPQSMSNYPALQKFGIKDNTERKIDINKFLEHATAKAFVVLLDGLDELESHSKDFSMLKKELGIDQDEGLITLPRHSPLNKISLLFTCRESYRSEKYFSKKFYTPWKIMPLTTSERRNFLKTRLERIGRAADIDDLDKKIDDNLVLGRMSENPWLLGWLFHYYIDDTNARQLPPNRSKLYQYIFHQIFNEYSSKERWYAFHLCVKLAEELVAGFNEGDKDNRKITDDQVNKCTTNLSNYFPSIRRGSIWQHVVGKGRIIERCGDYFRFTGEYQDFFLAQPLIRHDSGSNADAPFFTADLMRKSLWIEPIKIYSESLDDGTSLVGKLLEIWNQHDDIFHIRETLMWVVRLCSHVKDESLLLAIVKKIIEEEFASSEAARRWRATMDLAIGGMKIVKPLGEFNISDSKAANRDIEGDIEADIVETFKNMRKSANSEIEEILLNKLQKEKRSHPLYHILEGLAVAPITLASNVRRCIGLLTLKIDDRDPVVAVLAAYYFYRHHIDNSYKELRIREKIKEIAETFKDESRIVELLMDGKGKYRPDYVCCHIYRIFGLISEMLQDDSDIFGRMAVLMIRGLVEWEDIATPLYIFPSIEVTLDRRFEKPLSKLQGDAMLQAEEAQKLGKIDRARAREKLAQEVDSLLTKIKNKNGGN